MYLAYVNAEHFVRAIPIFHPRAIDCGSNEAHALSYNEDALDRLTPLTDNLMYLMYLVEPASILQEYTLAMTLCRAIKSQPNVNNSKSGDKTEDQIFYYQVFPGNQHDVERLCCPYALIITRGEKSGS